MRLGEHQLSSSTETSLTTSHAVAAIVVHPAYDHPKNDVALLKLSTKVETNVYTPVCLPYQGMDYTGLTATVIGYSLVAKQRFKLQKIIFADGERQRLAKMEE